MEATIVIPAYEPGERFIQLIDDLTALTRRRIIVIDDGSGNAFQPIFSQVEAKGAIVIHQFKNKGKGIALKTAMRFQLNEFKEAKGMVTADCDGQHRPTDILKIAERLDQAADKLILGTRDFGKNTPFKSYYGNKITSMIFHFSTGLTAHDTQTGLRGLPQSSLEAMIKINGARFEYEMNVLMAANQLGLKIEEIPIETVYFGNNAHSHFRAFKDSILIYQSFLKFTFSSLICSMVDLLLFYFLYQFVFQSSADVLLMATVTARIFSGMLNFTLNRQLVFFSKGDHSIEAIKYIILFLIQLFLSWLLVWSLSSLTSLVILLKIMVDLTLFIASYYIQKRYIFKETRGVQFG
ncbi:MULTISPECIES: bifunctional glycosyltransferase family 2/GtrA family protein [unclassified Enterococcus]|uniref:bifunctional glycosyltransferase family 2/GtrA family protein n=1 Tax=unclassified Enterococcus TaxID=2608891 RepID=UPI001556942B|nr:MULTISPECIES: bifunctional glycosyltransferase family 2/GtrA family protein [unclassified Enterococcus]MBS7578099.1 bifunctional glycosyltransferase family 2/GtrA family protein [Enterococcus sp. MMGLQ5-2]MBS7585359.1 bifunctional glycosyltransferase family 2/GtrA family protein [Enterococcus sp. MMGLQ5-1]NPD13216.1 bifunctional glycosyltransferase family 2/GtrA family protein [Enterococcus sp. MMGLQ5-1]NPD37930.1 bifunctional glycosyltransferase family 2/GtrA family protein [Enterococcus sp